MNVWGSFPSLHLSGLTTPVEKKLSLIPILELMHHDIRTATQASIVGTNLIGSAIRRCLYNNIMLGSWPLCEAPSLPPLPLAGLRPPTHPHNPHTTHTCQLHWPGDYLHTQLKPLQPLSLVAVLKSMLFSCCRWSCCCTMHREMAGRPLDGRLLWSLGDWPLKSLTCGLKTWFRFNACIVLVRLNACMQTCEDLSLAIL